MGDKVARKMRKTRTVQVDSDVESVDEQVIIQIKELL